MGDFLDDILLYKYSVIKKKKSYYDSLKDKVAKDQFNRYRLFQKAISTPGRVNLIAEVKKASPSKGLIRRDFDPVQIARTYADNGADALSVLTEDKYFLGKPGYLTVISENVGLPLLTKDFFVDTGQVYEAYTLGASAILLIVAVLDDQKLKELKGVADQLDLDCLVEVHNDEELKRALDLGAEIVGINNRDLRSFVVDLKVSESLIPRIPSGKIIVAESGLSSNREIRMLQEMGVNAVLIGETFMRADDIAAKMKEVMYGEG